MAATFTLTLRSVQADRVPWGITALCAVGLFLSAACWVVFAEVTVYEESSSARLEVKSEPFHVATFVAGRVIRSEMPIGSLVTAGQVLVVLDGEAERRAIEERREHAAALRARRGALSSEIEAEEAGFKAEARALELAKQESEAQLAAADARARYSRQNLERVAKLAAQKSASTDDLNRAQSENDVAEATATSLRLSLPRRESDRLADENDRRARLARLMREAAQLEGEAAVDEASIQRLEYELEQRTIRAPVTGRVEDVAPFRVGSVVRAAEQLGTVVPTGEPRIVAYFRDAAVGRIRTGQSARLRLEGFPWTQYGTLSAVVSRLGSESREGLIRVDLGLVSDQDSRIPVQHGLTGSVEVAVEKASPGVLVLRAAGQYLMSRRSVPRTARRAEP
jgi:membrane fusion protein (multidrug efflux system)